MATTIESLRRLYPTIPDAALLVFADNFVEGGEKDAWAAVREDARYDTWFPGNKTDDGDVRYDETLYAAAREQYRDVFRSAQIYNTTLFEDNITQLMQGEVSPNEFGDRVTQVYDRIVQRSEAIQQFYADNYGLEGLTTPALLAAALNPDIGDQLLTSQITAAEIGGQAASSGFSFTAERVEELAAEDMTFEMAGKTFKEAQTLVPIMDMLAKRHHDPDDDFDIEEFLSADFFKDPMQNYRMRRLMAQERSSFSNKGILRTNDYGAATGLVAE